MEKFHGKEWGLVKKSQEREKRKKGNSLQHPENVEKRLPIFLPYAVTFY